MPDRRLSLPKKRSKTGCFTCRQRKVRCDESQPICSACRRLSLPCEFPQGLCVASASQTRRRKPCGRIENSQGCNHDLLSSSNARALETTQMECEVGLDLEEGAEPLTPLWWSSLGQGILDVNWLEHVPDADQFFNDGRQNAVGPLQGENHEAAPDHTSVRNRDVTVLPEDQEALQHFTSTMVRFCILRNIANDNLYSYILINMGLFHSTLYDAMLAWSSLHLAHIQKKSNKEAKRRYTRAYTALIEDMGHGVAPTLLLASIWFLMQFQLILAESVEAFCELIAMAAEVARAELHVTDAEDSMSRLGPMGFLILVWMAARDSQIAYLGLGGKLLGCLKSYPHIYQLVDASSVPDHADESCGPAHLGPEITIEPNTPSELQKCLKLSFKNVTVAGQIKLLNRKENQSSDPSAWDAIRANLGILQRDIEEDDTEAAKAALRAATGDLTAMPIVSPIHYNRLLLLSSYYSNVIQYHMYRPAPARSEAVLSPEQCAERIIRLSQRAEAGRPNSPQGIWPTQLFIAAVTTPDPIYQAWARQSFQRAERWGVHIVKTCQLLDAVLQNQNLTGKKANIVRIMKETTGLFVF